MGKLSLTAGQPLQGSVQENVNAAPPSEMYGASSGYDGIEHQYPLAERGNLDLTNRQLIQFPKGLDATNATPAAMQEVDPKNFPPGSYGSEFSATIDDGPYNTVIPTIFDGKLHSLDEATQQYQKTGQHMGKFLYTDDGPDYKHSEAYSTAIHQRPITVNKKLYQGGSGR